jgi:hypothetical protein
MEKVIAQVSTTSLGQIGQGGGLGPFAGLDYSAAGSPLATVLHGISSIIGIMTILGAIWFIFQVIIGGIGWISAGGDKNKLQQARDRITNSLIGLIIVVAAWAILALVGIFFGWDILISDPATVIQNLQISP